VAVLAAAGCGSGARPAMPSPTPALSPATSPAPSDAAALVRATADKTGGDGITLHFVSNVAGLTAKGHGSPQSNSLRAEGDWAAPSAMRGKLAITEPGGVAVEVEVLTVDNVTFYTRLAGLSAWQRLAPKDAPGSFAMRQDLLAELAAATSVKVLRTELEGGVLCDVVAVKIDAAALDTTRPDLGARDNLRDGLGLSPEQIAAALKQTKLSLLLWIGRDDLLLHREDTDMEYGVAGGPHMTSHEKDVYSAFGEAIDPPIVVPTLAPTPAATPQGPSV